MGYCIVFVIFYVIYANAGKKLIVFDIGMAERGLPNSVYLCTVSLPLYENHKS